jgi:hypothetical protein
MQPPLLKKAIGVRIIQTKSEMPIQHTNQIIHSMFIVMLSLTCNQTVAELPVTPETLATRFEPTNGNVIYKDFVSFIVSGVVGIRRFDRHKLHSRYGTYVTVSDEAFAVLTIENNWKRWASMAERGAWKDSDVSSMYTTSRDKRKSQKQKREEENETESEEDDDIPQARRYRGWSAQGIARYNQLFDEIQESRQQPSFVALEDYLMEEFQAEDEEEGMRKGKRVKRDDDKPLPVARNELWIEAQPCTTVTAHNESIRLPAGMEELGGKRESV